MKSYKGEPAKYVQAKLDGHWLRVAHTGYTTRIGTALDLDWLIDRSRMPPGEVVLGELWYPGKPASYVKTAIKERDTNLRFTAFALESRDDEQPLAYIHAQVERMGFEFVDYMALGFDYGKVDEVGLRTLMQTVVGHPIEGLVFKDGNMLNERKWKEVRTIDLIVEDTVDGKGKYLGLIGALVCRTYEGHVLANVSGMDEETRVMMSDDDFLLGRVVEVAYQYVGSKGKLRHPRFVRMRDDKPQDECTIYQDDDVRAYYDAR